MSNVVWVIFHPNIPIGHGSGISCTLTLFFKTNLPPMKFVFEIYTSQKIISYWYHRVYIRYTHAIRVLKMKSKIPLYLKTVFIISKCEHFLFLLNKWKAYIGFLTPTLGIWWGLPSPYLYIKKYIIFYMQNLTLWGKMSPIILLP
jgi:hypothetical protein